MAKTKIDPTQKNYSDWAPAYLHFSAWLFGNRLPGCLITFQRRRNAYGFNTGSRFADAGGQANTDEIALNPRHFADRPLREVLSTLVHEMAHQYVWHFGKRSRRGYHNKSWARLMTDIRLVPSDTGKKGGKATGRRVHHFIRADGAFEPDAEVGSAGARKAEELRRPKVASNTRYICPNCHPLKCMWAKPQFDALCGKYGAQFEANPTDEKWPARLEVENS
jgi:hypothetical protein